MRVVAVSMPWGQDFDDWHEARPDYTSPGNQLGYDPELHDEGKGFLTSDGSVWTWPTYQMRPQHLEYNMRAKRLGLSTGSPFHIKSGEVYANGPGRELTPQLRAQIAGADPRLGFREQPPSNQPADFGHGYNILDRLDRLSSEAELSHARSPRQGRQSRWLAQSAGSQNSSPASLPVHPHITTGQPCTCPWGKAADARVLAGVAPKTASKIDWLRERNDKFMRTPDGQNAYEALRRKVEDNPKLDDLAPWIWREMKKQRLMATSGGGIYPVGQDAPNLDLDHLADWYGSNSPTRRGVDIMQLDLNGIDDRLKAWDDELASKMDQERQMHGTVVHDFTTPDWPENPRNGWTVRRIDNQEQATNEGDAMGHCIGSYGHDAENGDVGLFSLRDPKNQPHASIEMRPGANPQYDEIPHPGNPNRYANLLRPEGSLVHQIQGKQNMQPEEHYKDMLRDWFAQVPDLGANVEKTVVPAPRDPNELRYWHAPEHDYYDQQYQISPYEADEYGIGDDGDEFDYEGPPDWHKVIDSYLNSTGYRGEPLYRPDDGHDIRDIAHDVGHHDQFNQAVEEHRQDLANEFYRDIYDPKQYTGTAPTQWNQWPQGARMNALMGINEWDKSSLPYDPQNQPLGGPPTEIHPNQQKLFDEQMSMQPNQTWKDLPDGPRPYYTPWQQLAKTADYQGMTNWDTWNTKLMMDNEQELSEAQERMAAEGWSPEQIRDWALKHVVGPHNKQAIEDARSWNEIPQDERVDHHYEDFKEKHPEAMDLLHGLVGGPDVGDSEPTLIDPEIVNWHEIHQHINDSHNENQEYERERQRLQSTGLSPDWMTPGHDDATQHMREALYRHHGALPDEEMKPEYGGGYTGNDPRSAYRRTVNIPYDEYVNSHHFNPEDHMSLDARNALKTHLNQQQIERIRQEKADDPRMQNFHYVDPWHPKFPYDDYAEFLWYKNTPGSERDRLTQYDINDPAQQAILNTDPQWQDFTQNGYNQKLTDYTRDAIHDIHSGRANPRQTQEMQQALAARGISPEESAQMMRQRRQWDPQAQTWNSLEPKPPAPAPDPSLDQPGDLTLPEGWTSSYFQVENQ